ncbi:MAG TPA: glucosamine-6-phosphate deaminase [Planctomycetota bacterium]|nr:glucosamine-6-phosphate deaminase [Planctomycetota bacterium]
MRICRCPSKEQLALDAALAGGGLIRRALRDKGEATIVVATGTSQAAMLSHLVRENLDWSRVTAFHLDEYVGIRATHPASFRKYLQQRFVGKLKLRKFHPIAGEKNPAAECKRLNKLIADASIDVAFVGIGENGHLAFNDPPANVKTTEPYLLVDLDEACRKQQLGEGWFKILAEVPTRAISMSIRQILKAEHLICTVPDLRKAEAVHNALEGEVTPKVPASYLQEHPNASIFLDPQSASLLGPSREPIILELQSLEDFKHKPEPGYTFHLFIAADFTKIPAASRNAFARKALERGAVTITTWGKGAGSMEVVFDEESVTHSIRCYSKVTEANVIRTDSYKPEQLEDALFHYLDTVLPAADFEQTCSTSVAVIVGQVPDRERLLQSLSHPGAFIDEYVARDDADESQ